MERDLIKSRNQELEQRETLLDEATNIVSEFEAFLKDYGVVMYCDLLPNSVDLADKGEQAIKAEKNRIEEIKLRIKEFISLGGKPWNITFLDFKSLDENIAKIRRLKEIGRLDEQDDLLIYDMDYFLDLTSTDNVWKSMFHSKYENERVLIIENSKFKPLDFEELFQTILCVLIQNPEDVKNIGHMVSLLQNFIFSDNLWKWTDQYSSDLIYKNKCDAAKKVINVISPLRNNKFVYPEYLSILSQNLFVLGEWNEALYYYEQILQQPGVMNVQCNPVCYSGELELAAKIIHNICVILIYKGEELKAFQIARQYNYIYSLEYERIRRLIRNNPQFEFQLEKSFLQLTNIDKNKEIYFYFDDLLKYDLSMAGDGLLYASYQEALEGNKPYRIELNAVNRIEMTANRSFLIRDDNIPMGDGRILEIVPK